MDNELIQPNALNSMKRLSHFFTVVQLAGGSTADGRYQSAGPQIYFDGIDEIFWPVRRQSHLAEGSRVANSPCE